MLSIVNIFGKTLYLIVVVNSYVFNCSLIKTVCQGPRINIIEEVKYQY